MRLRFIEAMERRAARHCGEARRLLDARVAALRAADGDRVQIARTGSGGTASFDSTQQSDGQRNPLSELVAYMAAHAAARNHGASSDRHSLAGANPFATTELASLAYFRSTWSRLSAERRLTRSLATVPENAGPLNSHQLVHRALQTMRETSPGYLHHFMTYVDALLWLDQAGGNSAVCGVAFTRKAGKGRQGSCSRQIQLIAGPTKHYSVLAEWLSRRLQCGSTLGLEGLPTIQFHCAASSSLHFFSACT